VAAQLSAEAIATVDALLGFRARAACAILAIHASNATAVDGNLKVIASGPQMMEFVQHANYWKRLGYDDAASYDFLFEWYRLGFHTPKRRRTSSGG